MINKLTKTRERNWFLVFLASMLILIGAALMVFAVMDADVFGWWSLVIGLTGFTTVIASVMSIVENDSTWILLNLIIPG